MATQEFQEIVRVALNAKEIDPNDRTQEQNEALTVYNSLTKPILKNYIAVIDLEASSNTDVAGVGIVIGDKRGVVQQKLQLFVKEEELHFSTDCRENFWEKNPKVYGKIKRSRKKFREQIPKIVEFWDNAHKYIHKIPSDDSQKKISERDISLVSDNPEFDYSRLNPYLKKICDREPLRYTTDEKYRPIRDLGEALHIIGVNDIVSDSVKELVEHSHLPVEDAENIFLTNVIGEKLLMEWKDEKILEIRKFFKERIGGVIEEIKKNRAENTTHLIVEDSDTEDDKITN
jgi:hypothetical protein